METVEVVDEIKAVVEDMRARMDPKEFKRRMAQWRAACEAEDAAREVVKKREAIQQLRDSGRALADAVNNAQELAEDFTTIAKANFSDSEGIKVLAKDLPARLKYIDTKQFGADVQAATSKLIADLPQ